MLQAPSSRLSPLVDFLRELGADRVKHTGRTLLDHFAGTATILERWGATDPLIKAGLCHSIYGTEHFHDALLTFDARARVVERMGVEAERLAWVFCSFDRGSLYTAITEGAAFVKSRGGESIPVTTEEIRHLVWLVWANVLDQAPHVRRSAEVLARERRALAKVQHLLSDRARDELRELVGRDSAPSHKPGLRALFDLEDPTAFLRDHFPDRMFFARGPVERLAGLVNYELDELLRMKVNHIKAFVRTLDDEPVQVRIAGDQVKDLYNAGHTIYFHSLRSPEIDAWINGLDSDLGLLRGATRVSAFASRKGHGLKAHYDMNDNFVCQARGTKRWRIAPNTHVKHPSVGYTVGLPMTPVLEIEAPNGLPTELPTPFETVELTPGAVLFVPRGVWHDTETVDEASLHFNIQSGVPTWKDLTEFLFVGTTVLHADELRAPIMEMFVDGKVREGVADELKVKLGRLVEAVVAGDIQIDQAAFHRYVAKRRSAN